MSDQLTFFQAQTEHRRKKKKTRLEMFLETLERVTPWNKLEAKVSRYYAKAGPQGGRPAYPLAMMLRIHVYQILNNLSDPAMEDKLYDTYAVREYAGIGEEDRIPDETTILNFRHLLERHNLGKEMLNTINRQLRDKGLMVREGTIVDATFIEAPSSTKNKDGKRDPEMSSGKKGNTWHYGMKVHAGVDAENGLVHSLEFTGANEHDITQASKLLHGEESAVHGDAGYIGLEKRPEMQGRNIRCYIAERPGKRKQHAKGSIADRLQHLLASVRSKVEHVFHRIKIQFGYAKVRYRGIAKNANRLYLLAGFANLMRVRRQLVG
ncbi:MAG: IS5 family transposase [Oxalobacter sp.]|nr:IS5 family transposase [Oxalobacter sp.]